MESLFEYQEALLDQVDDRYFRPLFHQLDWEQQMFGITGLRGVGKTTMLLQYLKYRVEDRQQALYVTADHPWFYEHTLFDLANWFVKYNGNLLLIDEIHKHKHWSQELKNIYDAHPGLQVVFTASSMLDVLQGEADLSRRAVSYNLPGLSFREYLMLFHTIEFPVFHLEAILEQPGSTATHITRKHKPLPLFRSYLRNGYFPFAASEKEKLFHHKLNQIINIVLENDLQMMKDYSASNIFKIKQLLGVIAESAPFEPNISKLARKLTLGRDTVKKYLYNLQKAGMLNLVQRASKGTAALQKPDKIYLENSNFSFALKTNPEVGTIRETFFLNQLKNAAYDVALPKNGDFIVNKRWTFEIGGAGKSSSQIADTEKAWLALDDLEKAYLNRIPLWLFGFLY